jgi:hypothetical protein
VELGEEHGVWDQNLLWLIGGRIGKQVELQKILLHYPLKILVLGRRGSDWIQNFVPEGE